MLHGPGLVAIGGVPSTGKSGACKTNCAIVPDHCGGRGADVMSQVRLIGMG